jgi:hypothetical protein
MKRTQNIVIKVYLEIFTLTRMMGGNGKDPFINEICNVTFLHNTLFLFLLHG